jgi:uncharacterized protein
MNLPSTDPTALALVTAIRNGDVAGLQQRLTAQPELATLRVVDAKGTSRTLLHIVADWPGLLPDGARLVTILAKSGAEVDAPVGHAGAFKSAETPLHWAASCNDVDVIDALLDCGADIEVAGAVFTGGTPMSNAVIFAQWRAARRLLERGAATTLWQAAALGLVDRIEALCALSPAPTADELTNAFWHACRGGQQAVATLLLSRGAQVNWIGHDRKTALDAAHEFGHDPLIEWLRAQGAKRARELAA